MRQEILKQGWIKKLTKEQWDIGVENLLEAGFDKKDIGVYILFGLPGERDGEVVSTIAFAKSYGFRPHLAYYTPIPGSKLFEKAKSHSPYPIDEDPIFQNNAICLVIQVDFPGRRGHILEK